MPNVKPLMDHIAADPDQIDHGWMLLERDSIGHPKVLRTLEYIRSNASDGVLVLDEDESQLMAEALGETSSQKIRRHIIVQLATLRLIERDMSTPDWRLQITHNGHAYLNSANRKRHFQREIVERLVFCHPDWATDQRARRYSDFSIRPYEVVMKLMPELGEKLYLEEMTYFVSKVRSNGDVPDALALIKMYRGLNPAEKNELKLGLQQILNRLSSDKFGNWRKHNKRTFELLSMGTALSMRYESDDPFDTFPLILRPGVRFEESPMKRFVDEAVEEYPYKDLPEITRDDVEFNSGVEGENSVVALLEEYGFEIRILTGSKHGYDILATKDGARFLIEVKSALDRCSPTLTENEYQTASRYGRVYILAIVEHVMRNPETHFVVDPVGQLGDHIVATETTAYRIPRTRWIEVAQEELD